MSANILVLGADILNIIKKDSYNIEELYNKLMTEKNISINQYLDTLTFLWLVEAIEYNSDEIKKTVKNNDSKKDL
ncbi:hypothetical protein HZQ01_14210 [Elizabethkingia anophelis]|nr:hypothetical protein [Elizabethkingia anophelis]